MTVRASGGGIGFFGILGIVFIVLKLTEQIAWPWIWVLVPFWGGFALAVILFGLAILISIVPIFFAVILDLMNLRSR